MSSKLILKKKFDLLMLRAEKPSYDKKSWVINLSSRILNDNEELVLSKGLNFAPSPKFKPIDILAPIEEVLQDLPNNVACDVRQEIVHTLRYYKGPQENLNFYERKSIKDLKEDTSIIILPADKGKATVILNKLEYDQKMYNLLHDDKTYKKITVDPTQSTQTKMNNILLDLKKSKKLDDKLYFKLHCSSGVIPKIYGLPKIHKNNIPLRPIVSYYTSPTYNLSKYLSGILTPYSINEYSIKTTHDFISKIKNLTLEHDDIMVSFDVVSLFTCVPTDTACTCIKTLLQNDPLLNEKTKLHVNDILKLLNVCVNSTSFIFNKELFQQKFGTAMGSPVSPVIANILMCSIENFALNTFNPKPSFWCRFVDDTFCILKKDVKSIFLDFLNTINPHIKFTMEEEELGNLPFLDVLVHRENLQLTTSVYRKPTHTDRYLDFHSCHPPSHKAAVIQTLFKRASENSSTIEDRDKEEKHLIEILKMNNYPNYFINKHIPRIQISPKKEKSKPSRFVCIPYIGETSEKIKRILKKHDIGTSHKPKTTLQNILCHPKDPTPVLDKTHVVYALPCHDCHKKYIGQTSKKLKERLGEHKKAVKNWDKLSAVADHVHSLDHRINWDNATALHENKSTKQRLFLESYEFNRNDTFTKNRAIKLSENYYNLLKQS